MRSSRTVGRRVLAVGRLIVIEGLDGSGKRTLTESLARRWRAAGRTVATMAFPRYGIDVHADLVRDALYGRLGDLSDSVYGPALLFALDRRAAAPEIRELLGEQRRRAAGPVRHVERGLRFGAAGRSGGRLRLRRLGQAAGIDRFGVPAPDRQILLATPLAGGRRNGPGTGRRQRRPGVGQLRGGRRRCSNAPARCTGGWPRRTTCRRGRC